MLLDLGSDWLNILHVSKAVHSTLRRGIRGLRTADLSNSHPRTKLLIQAHCTQLRELEYVINSGTTSEEFGVLLARNCATLDVVRITSHIGYVDLAHMLTPCKALTRIGLGQEVTRNNSKSWIATIQQLPALRSIDIQGYEDSGNVVANSVSAMQMQPLELVVRTECVTDLLRFLMLPRQHFAELRSLEIEYWSGRAAMLGVGSIDFPHLQDLRFVSLGNRIPTIGPAIVLNNKQLPVWNLPALESLDLNVKVTVMLEMPNLITADLDWRDSSCVVVMASLIKCSRLRALRIDTGMMSNDKCVIFGDAVSSSKPWPWPELWQLRLCPKGIRCNADIFKQMGNSATKLADVSLAVSQSLGIVGLDVFLTNCPGIGTLGIYAADEKCATDNDKNDSTEKSPINLPNLKLLDVYVPFPGHLLGRLRTPALQYCTVNLEQAPPGAVQSWLMTETGQKKLEHLTFSGIGCKTFTNMRGTTISSHRKLRLSLNLSEHVSKCSIAALMATTPQTSKVFIRPATARRSTNDGICKELVRCATDGNGKFWPALSYLEIYDEVECNANDVLSAIRLWPELRIFRLKLVDEAIDKLRRIKDVWSFADSCSVVIAGFSEEEIIIRRCNIPVDLQVSW
jgi:hypothetical protein